jgi:hypothetical protein
MTEATDEMRRDPAQWARLLAEGERIECPCTTGHDFLYARLTVAGELEVEPMRLGSPRVRVCLDHVPLLMRAVLEALDIRPSEERRRRAKAIRDAGFNRAVQWHKEGDHPAVQRGTTFPGVYYIVQDARGDWYQTRPGDYIEPDGDGFRVRRSER